MSGDRAIPPKSAWDAAIERALGRSPALANKWTDLKSMLTVLTPFMAPGLNHTMAPGGGGYDVQAIAISAEAGCIEFTLEPRLAEICRPAVLYFEHIVESPTNSFFLLETLPLQPSGVYGADSSAKEEVVELSPLRYIDRAHLDTGVLEYDDNGNEVPLPKTARLIGRYLRAGKFLIVEKYSIWNRTNATYDGRHNRMTASQIREAIQSAIHR